MSDLSDFRDYMVGQNIESRKANGWRFEDPDFDGSHSYHTCPDCDEQVMERDGKYYCPTCRHYYDEYEVNFVEGYDF